MFPSKRRKTYRQYLTPGAEYVLPTTTEWRKQRSGNEDSSRTSPTLQGAQADENESRGESSGQTTISRNMESSQTSPTTIQEAQVDEESRGESSDQIPSGSSVGSQRSGSSEEDFVCDDDEPSQSESNEGGSNSGRLQGVSVEDPEDEIAGGCEFLFDLPSEAEELVRDDEEAGPSDGGMTAQDDRGTPQGDSETVQEDGGTVRRDEASPTERVEVDNDGRRKGLPYAEKYDLHETVGLVDVKQSKFEVLLMIFHMVLRHGMTGRLVEDLLAFINTICGRGVVPASKYLFNKIFQPDLLLKFHFYCTICTSYLGERESFKEPRTVCPTCKVSCDVKNLGGTNFFITLPLTRQLEQVLQKPGIKILSNRSDSTNICDFRDGYLHKMLYESGELFSDPDDFISITFNSDGAAVFSGRQSCLWPVWILVNNIHPTQRFLGENLILCALWFGKMSPDFSMFLMPFIKELQELASPDGGITPRESNGEVKRVRVVAPMASVDSVAKPKMQKHRQYNGKFGCGYCLHPGETIPGINGVRYPVRRVGEYPRRTKESMRADMYKAHELDLAGQLRKTKNTRDNVNGTLGLSALLALPGFDIVEGFVIDYMHAILLGVCPKLLTLWEEKKKNCIIEGMSLRMVDDRVIKLKPPSNVQEPPKPLSKRGDFKAKEYRAILLYYVLPCFRGILKTPYFENVRMFVKAIFILLSDYITPEDLNEADSLLKNFVKTFNKLYGDENMVYNVHLCSHIVSCVKAWGPLSVFSAFAFESGNGELVSLNEGTRGIATQICLKYAMVRSMKEYIQNIHVSPDVIDFCTSVIAFKEVQKSEEYSGSRTFSSGIIRSTDDDEKRVLREAGLEPAKELLTFNRVVKDGIVYCSSVYTKKTLFNDTCVRLVDGKYGVIKKIFKTSFCQFS